MPRTCARAAGQPEPGRRVEGVEPAEGVVVEPPGRGEARDVLGAERHVPAQDGERRLRRAVQAGHQRRHHHARGQPGEHGDDPARRPAATAAARRSRRARAPPSRRPRSTRGPRRSSPAGRSRSPRPAGGRAASPPRRPPAPRPARLRRVRGQGRSRVSHRPVNRLAHDVGMNAHAPAAATLPTGLALGPVALTVTDLDRSIAWYERIAGAAPPRPRRDDRPARRRRRDQRRARRRPGRAARRPPRRPLPLRAAVPHA